MDIKMLAEQRAERENLEQAIITLERLASWCCLARFGSSRASTSCQAVS
jgi:hypothetical protein